MTPSSQSRDHKPVSRTSTLPLFFSLLAVAFVVEFLIMFILPRLLPDAGDMIRNLIDAFALVILIAPFVWVFFVRNLSNIAMAENARAEALLECIADGVVAFDGLGIITSLNPAAERMFGYPAAEMSGRDIRVLVPEAEGAPAPSSAPDILAIARERQGCASHKVEGRRSDGSSFPLDITVSKVHLDGQSTYVAIARDNSERKSAEVALMEQTEFAQNLILNSATPTFVLDGEHRVILWNRACEELTGVNAADVVGTDGQWRPFYDRKRPVLADLVLAPDNGKLDDLYTTVANSRYIPEGLKAERWYTDADGRERYIIFTAAPIRNSRGEIVAAIQTIEDITGMREADRELAEAEEKLRAITSTATDAIILVDNEGKVLYWNDAAERMTGYHSGEALGKNITMIVPPKYLEAHKQAFSRFAASGQGRYVGKVYEVSALRKDGTEFPVELSISGFQLKGKWHSAGVVRDITERKSLENQLRHAQKMEAVGTLAGGIAHDFNNILTTVIGFGTLILMDMARDDKNFVRVNNILAAADRAATLTQSLLAFGRKGPLETRPVDLNEIVARVERLFIRLLGEDIDVTSTLSDEDLTIMADPTQIEQVLMNLATNARDAMPGGGVLSIDTGIAELDREFIKAHGYGEPGRYALLVVNDTGEGMDKGTVQRIFEPFFTTKDVGKGTGLGLAIVYGIVKQHNGYINCYSEPGLGSTFRIYLPLAERVAESMPVEAESAPVGGTETILMAEDDADLRELNRHLLETFGYDVVEAVNGEDAVRQFRDHADRIGLVFLDVIMPKLNGREAYEEIRKLRPDVKALFTSGYAGDILTRDDREQLNFLPKPINPTMLLKKIREILDA